MWFFNHAVLLLVELFYMPRYMYFICMCDITTSFNVNLCIYVLCVNSCFTEGHKVD